MLIRPATAALLAATLSVSTALAVGPAGHPQPQPQPQPPRSHPRHSNTFGIDGALQRVARKFFPVGVGQLVQFEILNYVPEYYSAAEFEKFAARDRQGRLLGTFMRMRVYPDDDSIIDLAFLLEDGRVAAVEPLRPIEIKGKAYLDLPKALMGLREYEIASYANDVALFFKGLVFVTLAAEGESGEDEPLTLTQAQGTLLKSAIRFEMPELPIGSPMPQFDLKDRKGEPFRPERFAGQRALFVVGRVQDPLTISLLEMVKRYTERYPGRFLPATALCNIPAELEQFELRGGRLSGIVVPDENAILKDALKVAFMPGVVVFDRSGKYAGLIEPPFTSYEELAAQLDKIQ